MEIAVKAWIYMYGVFLCGYSLRDSTVSEDVDVCYGNNCRNGATCHPDMTSYTCACMKGFSGPFCEVNIDNCRSNPCFFNGKCIDGVNSYTCACANGTIGRRCEIYIGQCYQQPCTHGTCTPTLEGFKCACATGYTGTYCEYNINECFSIPCVNGNCVDLVNGFRCECWEGYTGQYCDSDSHLVHCNGSNCRFGTCAVNESGSFCQCFPGFTSIHCDVNIDDCTTGPCVYGACVDYVNAYVCNCSKGFVGTHCDIPSSDPCRHNPCVNGFCSVTNEGFQCVCQDGYIGRTCDRKLLPCDRKSGICDRKSGSCDQKRCQSGRCDNSGSKTCSGEGVTCGCDGEHNNPATSTSTPSTTATSTSTSSTTATSRSTPSVISTIATSTTATSTPPTSLPVIPTSTIPPSVRSTSAASNIAISTLVISTSIKSILATAKLPTPSSAHTKMATLTMAKSYPVVSPTAQPTPNFSNLAYSSPANPIMTIAPSVISTLTSPTLVVSSSTGTTAASSAATTSGCPEGACRNGGTCQQGEKGSHVCLCDTPYTGSRCEVAIPRYGTSQMQSGFERETGTTIKSTHLTYPSIVSAKRNVTVATTPTIEETQTVDDVITVEAAVIGALGATLIVVTSGAVFVLYRRRQRGSVYISSPRLPGTGSDTSVKKRYSSRDIHSELRAGCFLNPTFVSTATTPELQLGTHTKSSAQWSPPSPSSSSTSANSRSTSSSTSSAQWSPPSPSSSSTSANSRSTSSSTSRGQWYDTVQPTEHCTLHAGLTASLAPSRDTARMRDTSPSGQRSPSNLYGNYSVPRPSVPNGCSGEPKPRTVSPRSGAGLRRVEKTEDIPKFVRTSGRQQIGRPCLSNTTVENPFYIQDDGNIGLRLTGICKRSPVELPALLHEILATSGDVVLGNHTSRWSTQHVSGAEVDKSEA